MDWAGAARLALTLMFAGAALVIYRYREFVTRFYTPVANAFSSWRSKGQRSCRLPFTELNRIPSSIGA